MNNQNSTAVPNGFKKNGQGHLIPDSMVKPIDLARDDLVEEVAMAATDLQKKMRNFKTRVFDDVAAFIEMSAEQYGSKLGGQKGNVTLMSYDGRYKLQRAMADNLVFDERLQVAKSLIDECIHRWSQGSRDEIRALVEHAFQTDKQGNISTSRVLGLKQLDIKDAQWREAMEAIGDSVQVVGSKAYIRIYERVNDTDEYRPISLDLAAL